MERVLFSSHLTDVELSFSFSDHSLSSDDDLLPVSHRNTQTGGQSTAAQTSSGPTLANTSPHETQKCGQTSGKQCGDNTWYKSCPICQCLGPKSINHIKLCAKQRFIDPKRVIQLLSKCPKIEHSVDTKPQKRYQSKTSKKSNKLSDNYVINFESGKPLKLSINSKLKSDKSRYELCSLDATQRKTLLMSKITDQFIIYNDMRDNICKQSVVDNTLPKIWTLSLLDSESDQYFVDGFHKYQPIIS